MGSPPPRKPLQGGAAQPGWTPRPPGSAGCLPVCSRGAPRSPSAPRPFPSVSRPWLQDGHAARAWPIKALSPAGHGDWLRDGLQTHAWPIRAVAEHFAIVTGRSPAGSSGLGAVRTLQAGAATGSLPPASWGRLAPERQAGRRRRRWGQKGLNGGEKRFTPPESGGASDKAVPTEVLAPCARVISPTGKRRLMCRGSVTLSGGVRVTHFSFPFI